MMPSSRSRTEQSQCRMLLVAILMVTPTLVTNWWDARSLLLQSQSSVQDDRRGSEAWRMIQTNPNERWHRMRLFNVTIISNPPAVRARLQDLLRSRLNDTSTTTCYHDVQFRFENMTLCNFIPYGLNFGDELGPAVSARIASLYFSGSNQVQSDCDKTPPLIGNYSVHHEEKLYDKKITHRLSGRQCLFSVGSIFHYVRADDWIWGTGMNLYWQRRLRFPKEPLTVAAVRGPKSLAWLSSSTRDLNDKVLDQLSSLRIGYGDPGFLVPFLFPLTNDNHDASKYAARKQQMNELSRLCIVPHFHDLQHAVIQHINVTYPASRLTIISPFAHWEEVTTAIATKCDAMASSSLHGLIVADALGLPLLWFQLPESTTATTEGSFKYQDYFAGVALLLQNNATTWRGNVQAMLQWQPQTNLTEHVANPASYSTPLTIDERLQVAREQIATFPIHAFVPGQPK